MSLHLSQTENIALFVLLLAAMLGSVATAFVIIIRGLFGEHSEVSFLCLLHFSSSRFLIGTFGTCGVNEIHEKHEVGLKVCY